MDYLFTKFIFYSEDLEINFYFGLKGYYSHSSPDEGFNQFYYYYNSDDTFSDKCNVSGKSAIALTIIACIFSFISTITNGAGFVNEDTVIKAVGAVLSIISCIFGIIAVGIFMTTCYNKVHDSFDDVFNDTKGLHYGNGSILATTALLCNFFAFILVIINIVAGGTSTPMASK